MRFGCCVPIDEAEIIQKNGYDYLELPTITTIQPLIDEARFAEIKTKVGSLGIVPEAFNILLREDLRVVGPQVDRRALEEYVETVFRRARELGGQIVVFGGKGEARSIPEDFSPRVAREQLLEFVWLLAKHAAEHGLIVAIEPLNREETNIINTIEEALSIAKEIDRKEIRILVDAYHAAKEDDLGMVEKAGEYLAHVHVADSNRLPPGYGTFDFSSFFAALRHAGYKGRASVECVFTDLAKESQEAIRFLKGVESESHSEAREGPGRRVP